MSERYPGIHPAEFRLHPLGTPEADAQPGDYVSFHDDGQTLVIGVVRSISAGGIATVRAFESGRLININERRLRPIAEEHSVVDAYFEWLKRIAEHNEDIQRRRREIVRIWP
jgi:hypothetical protein